MYRLGEKAHTCYKVTALLEMAEGRGLRSARQLITKSIHPQKWG